MNRVDFGVDLGGSREGSGVDATPENGVRASNGSEGSQDGASETDSLDIDAAGIVEVPDDSAGKSRGQDSIEGGISKSEIVSVGDDVDDQDSSGGGDIGEENELRVGEERSLNVPYVIVVAWSSGGSLEDESVLVGGVNVSISIGRVLLESSRKAIEPGEGSVEVNSIGGSTRNAACSQ